ncbi:MAG: hypothetical protein SVY15_01395 [Halobacteriota archaeon]|nr:hypothetical protein [Halobacteriota archaeon]
MSKGIISFISHAFALGIIVTVVFFLLAGVSAAEVPSEDWNRTYGGGRYDYVHSVQETSDGGYVFTASRLKGNYIVDRHNDAVLLKIEGEERAMDAFTPGFEILTGVVSAALIAAVLVFRRKRE